MKQRYSKPVVTRIELKAEEALVTACKTGTNIGNGYDLPAGSSCVPVLSSCRDGVTS